MSGSRFRAVTWNVYHGTAAAELAPILAAQRAKRVSVLLMQEAGGGDLTELCRDNGFDTYVTDQYRVAWDPERWVKVAARTVRLSETASFAKGSTAPRHSEAAEVILCDRVGRSLTALSYHTPAHVQVPEKGRPPRRYASFLESMRTLGELADDALTTGWLAGGDDNWDEDRGLQTPEATRVLLGNTTGLRQVQAPSATHGKRRIDDFRVPRGGNLRPGKGWVADGGGDHRLHGRELIWRTR